jgi:hypothetical protein
MTRERVIIEGVVDSTPRKSARRIADEEEAARALHRDVEETEGSLARIEARRRAGAGK